MINKTLLYNNIKNDIKNEELRTLYLSIAKKINKNVNINTIYESINKVLALPQFALYGLWHIRLYRLRILWLYIRFIIIRSKLWQEKNI